MKKIGILITPGTDTLAWTHAFVRYALKTTTPISICSNRKSNFYAEFR